MSNSQPSVEFGSISYTVDESDTSFYRIEVIRNGSLNYDSRVNFNVVGGTATGDDYYLSPQQEVHFSYGQNRQFIEIQAFNDGLIEDIETIELEIVAGDEAQDNYVVGEQNTTTVEILDGSPTGGGTGTPTVEFGAVSYQVSEDQGSNGSYYNNYTYVVEVIRSGDLSFWSEVDVNVLGGTANSPSDYDYVSRSVWFNEGQSRQFVEIELYNDSEVEDIETIELELVTGSGYNALVGEQNTTT
ncbi:Calx-beta domain-containing protein, partial [Crocosphaera sp.]|uniref:Calx-beta domain-containing protein n=1 Tax=Crocosphaera sp. TaxID=2729996 RepID=UPI003F29D28A